MRLRNPSVVTYHDMIEHLSDYRGGTSSDTGLSTIKRAIRQAYRELMDIHDWRYCLREHQVTLEASYNTGTISYDHTGGANERLVTLVAGTMPANAAQYRLKIGNDIYPVDQRLSDTTFTLVEDLNPGIDLASTSDWIAYRNTYSLPADFISMDHPIDRTNWWSMQYISPSEWSGDELFGFSGQPFNWTIMADPDIDGGHAIRVVGYPGDRRRMVFIYRRTGFEPIVSGLETEHTVGTVSLTAATSAVVGNGTSFSDEMIDTYLRVSKNANEPTSVEGDNISSEQYKVRSVTDATNLTLFTNAAASVSNRGYLVSDYLDMDRPMVNAMRRGAEWQLESMTGKPTYAAAKYSEFLLAVRLAKESDDKANIQRSAGGNNRRGIGTMSDYAIMGD